MQSLHRGIIPVNFDQIFASVSHVYSHATRAATRGGWIHLAAGFKNERKSSLEHLGPKIWESIDPSLYDISTSAFKRQLKGGLNNAYIVIDCRVLTSG